jgi:hypothetical protein
MDDLDNILDDLKPYHDFNDNDVEQFKAIVRARGRSTGRSKKQPKKQTKNRKGGETDGTRRIRQLVKERKEEAELARQLAEGRRLRPSLPLRPPPPAESRKLYYKEQEIYRQELRKQNNTRSRSPSRLRRR